MPTQDQQGAWRCDACGCVGLGGRRTGARSCELEHAQAAERLAASLELFADSFGPDPEAAPPVSPT